MTRILIVDDKEENLYYLQALLSGNGYAVEAAHDGAEALAKARQSPPDLVISDLLMPVMDGYSLLRHWKADARLKHAPFIVYTSTYTEPEDERLALSLGADAFILKPTEPVDFLARVRQVQAGATAAGPIESKHPVANEGALLQVYNATLIHKLEEKTAQLEQANRLLHRDIAERKTAEAALRASKAELVTLAEAMPQIVWITRPDGGNIYFNQQWMEYTGLTLAESLGDGWNTPFHPDDRARAWDAWQSATAAIGTYSVEARLRRADGAYRWWLVRGVPFKDAAGKVLKWFGTCTDIHELKETEERFRATFENAAVGIAHTGFDERFLQVNKKLCQMLGYTAVEMLALTTRDIVHPEDMSSYTVDASRMLAGEIGEHGYVAEKRCVRKSGAALWTRSTASIARDDDGKPLYFIRVIEDISDRKRAEEALLALNDELEQKVAARTQALDQALREAQVASRAKSEFLATMSHEIRTPMNGVIGMIDVLQQSSLSSDQVEMVGLIRESAFSLLDIINDILDFSKIEAGKLELEREAFALESVVDSVGSLFNDMAQKKDVTLTLFVDPAIPAQVAGDALRLRQVLTNVVNNAIKFSSGQPRPGRVSVRALLVEDGPQQVIVELQVTDNGIGMDEEVRSRLFTAFSQADASTTRRFGGTGLGLVIAHHLVKLMGGEITVQSAAGEGASFKIRLPFVPLPGHANSKAPPSEVSGLHCVVVANAGGLADDLAAYLVHAQAQVDRETDLAGARQRHAGRNGMSVWIVDAGDESQTIEQNLTAAGTDPGVRLVRVERGKRRRPRVVAPDTIMIDGNALSRRTFLSAVAIAAGRASLEAEAINPASAKTTAIAPTREKALRERRLILIAEDNESNQKVVVRQLALLGYAADVVADGREALERWKSGDYALLLTDLHMPHMDGYELSRTIRAQEAQGTHMPIIALTANALKGEEQRCRAHGMDDYRSKPAPLLALKAMLDEWLPAGIEVDAPVASSPFAAVTRHSATPLPADVDVLRDLVGDDPEVVNEFLIMFRESTATLAAQLRAACAAGQPDAAADTAHKLKASARAVGAFALAEVCEAIEVQGKAGKGEAVVALLPRFDEEMAAVKDYLDNHGHDSREHSRRVPDASC